MMPDSHSLSAGDLVVVAIITGAGRYCAHALDGRCGVILSHLQDNLHFGPLYNVLVDELIQVIPETDLILMDDL
ncbi:MAG TPA: hypothetical protein EYG51_22100 [Pseudomonadales bacterium]|nr:hypothetical protein [Pseudomonadales bacterium]